LVEPAAVGATAPAGIVAAVAGSLLADVVPGNGHLLMLLSAALLGWSAYRMATQLDPADAPPSAESDAELARPTAADRSTPRPATGPPARPDLAAGTAVAPPTGGNAVPAPTRRDDLPATPTDTPESTHRSAARSAIGTGRSDAPEPARHNGLPATPAIPEPTRPNGPPATPNYRPATPEPARRSDAPTPPTGGPRGPEPTDPPAASPATPTNSPGAPEPTQPDGPPTADGPAEPVTIDRRRLATIGAGAGLLAGLLGVGGGIIMVPGFTQWARMPVKRAIGTSLACVALFAVAGTITHGLQGNIDWRFGLLLAVGVIPGARVGAALAIAADARTLRRVVAAFLGVTAVLYAGGELLALS
jgi:uncharacterized membrane protein YfcA